MRVPLIAGVLGFVAVVLGVGLVISAISDASSASARVDDAKAVEQEARARLQESSSERSEAERTRQTEEAEAGLIRSADLFFVGTLNTREDVEREHEAALIAAKEKYEVAAASHSEATQDFNAASQDSKQARTDLRAAQASRTPMLVGAVAAFVTGLVLLGWAGSRWPRPPN